MHAAATEIHAAAAIEIHAAATEIHAAADRAGSSPRGGAEALGILSEHRRTAVLALARTSTPPPAAKRSRTRMLLGPFLPCLLASPLSSTPFGAKTRPAKRPHELLGDTLWPADFGAKFRTPKQVRPKRFWAGLSCGSGGTQKRPATGPSTGAALGPPFRGHRRLREILMKRNWTGNWTENSCVQGSE